MSQMEIEVLLTVRGEQDVLEFRMNPGSDEDYYIDLNSESNQDCLKKVFSKLLELAIENDITLVYRVEPGYSKGLYKDVCEEYVKDLNKEIEDVRNLLKEKMK